MNNLISENQKLKCKIQFEDTSSGQQYMAPIIEAICGYHKIEIIYQNYCIEHASILKIEQYFVKIFKQRWYVVTYNKGVGK